MIKEDENALMCDLAETYHIYDYKQLPLKQVAVFSYGLPPNSRIKMKMSGQSHSINTMILAGIFDRVNLLLYSFTKDGQKGQNKPRLLVNQLMGIDEKKPQRKERVFESGKAFDEERERLLKLIEEGGD